MRRGRPIPHLRNMSVRFLPPSGFLMKYPLSVSSPPHQQTGSPPGSSDQGVRTEYGTSSTPRVRRFPPVLQFLTRAEQAVEAQLQTIALSTFHEGKSLDQICSNLYQAGLSLGYKLTIGLQEVYSHKMPSFPNQTVMTCLIMIDFSPTRPKATS